jgi:hypothetical protein
MQEQDDSLQQGLPQVERVLGIKKTTITIAGIHHYGAVQNIN